MNESNENVETLSISWKISHMMQRDHAVGFVELDAKLFADLRGRLLSLRRQRQCFAEPEHFRLERRQCKLLQRPCVRR